MRFFRISGPVNPKKNYYVPDHLDEDEIRLLIDQEEYFILHAPRQSGKTTAVELLVDKLNREGKYTVIFFSIEAFKAPYNILKSGELGENQYNSQFVSPILNNTLKAILDIN